LAFRDVSRVAQRYHTRHRAVLEAKPGQTPDLGDPMQRRVLARREQEQLKQIAGRVSEAWAAGESQRDNLLAEVIKSDAPLGAELRSHMRGMKPGERNTIAKQPQYFQAMAHAPAELSGFTPGERDVRIGEEMRRRYPEVLREIDEQGEAVAFVRTALRSTEFAVEHELRLLGTPKAEPPPTPEPRPWVA